MHVRNPFRRRIPSIHAVFDPVDYVAGGRVRRLVVTDVTWDAKHGITAVLREKQPMLDEERRAWWR